MFCQAVSGVIIGSEEAGSARRELIDKWLLPGLSNSDLDTIGCGYLCVANIIAIFVGYSVRLVPCLLGI